MSTLIWLSLVHSVAASIDMDAGYISYLSSDMYLESIRGDLMPENCYLILFRKFQGLLEDSVFESALRNTDCDSLSTLVANNHLINPNYEARIPIDDFISSREIFKLVNAISDRAYANGVEWPSGHVVTNLLTYHLMIILSLKSTCDTIDCRVFRKLIEQFHFRLTIIIEDSGEKIEQNKFDFFRPLDILFSVRHQIEQQVETSVPRCEQEPERVARATYLSFSFFDCCGWLCSGRKRQRHPTTQILTPRNDSMEILRGRQNENAADALAYNSKRQLDSILTFLGSRNSHMTTIQQEVVKPLMGVARGVLYSWSGAGKERTIQKLFRFIRFVETANEDENSLPRILDMSHEIVSQLRPFIL